MSSVSLLALASLACIALALCAMLFKFLYVPLGSSAKASSSPPELQLPASKITELFFGERFEFIRDGFKATSSSIYQLTLFRRKAIVLSGEEGRELFLREKGLSIYDSFSILLGSNTAQFNIHQVNAIIKRIISMQRPENLQPMIPLVLSTCERNMDSWGTQTILDPCSSIHEITFQTMMSNAFFDIANDPAMSSRLKTLVDIVDSPANPYSTWFSWLPNTLMFRKIISAVRMFRIVQKALKSRKSSGVRRNDVVQQMLDNGDSTIQIFGFILGLSLAGARATGTIVSWLIMQLSSNPEWSTAVQEEIKVLTTTQDTSTETLSTIPLQAWETQTPILDRCIRETLRTSQPYTAMRRNTGPDITMKGYTIPSGSLVVYPFLDTSINPAYYGEPLRWDPSREAKKEFISWGAGKHGCKGQRLAVLNMKLVAASILCRFDISLVDAVGAKMETAPVPDWNDSVTCRPMNVGGILLVRK